MGFFEIMKAYNNSLVNPSKRNESFAPRDRLIEGLQARYHMSPVSHQAFELEASMDGESGGVKRALPVPARYRFSWLRRILEDAFDMYESTYEFMVGERRIPESNGIYEDDPEAVEGYEKLEWARDVFLDHVLTVGTSFLFRHGWEEDDVQEVSIHVKSLLPDYDKAYATWTDEEGLELS